MNPALQVRDLARRFGRVEALRGVSFSVERGELYGLVGPDGAGKTTIIRALAGLVGIDEGEVRVLGADPLREGRRVHEALGLMPQEYSLYGDLTVTENLTFFGRLYCLPRRVYEQRAQRLLEITRLTRFTDRRADALSGGMYKKLALACALLHEPEVLLLDEPTNGVDPVSRRELWDLLYEFVGEGMTILISTPYMEEAERCHRVGLAHEGRLVAEGRPADLVRELELEAYEVRGATPREAEAVLSTRSEVRSTSLVGARMRIVVEPGSRRELERLLADTGATLSPTPTNFEDLFLARIGALAREAA